MDQETDVADKHPCAVYAAVLDHLRGLGVDLEIHLHEPVRTIEEAHERVPHLTAGLLKTVVFRLDDGGWVLAAVTGPVRIHYRLLADALGVRRTALRAVGPEEVEAALGFQVGGVGPFALGPAIRVVLDAPILELERVLCGSGRNDRTLELAPGDLARAAGAIVHPIGRPTGG